MSEFFSLKIRWKRVLATVLVAILVGPYLGVLLPNGGTAEQAWLDQVIVEVETLRDKTDDPEIREVLEYTARRYRKIGPFSVHIRDCPGDIGGLNVPYCPGVTLDPFCLEDPQLGMITLVHEAQHDYFPYWGHDHFRIFR
jgi:hypothetical protein